MTDQYFCYHCGADSADLLQLSEAEMEDFDERHPDVDRALIYEGCCPCCGFAYEGDEDEDE